MVKIGVVGAGGLVGGRVIRIFEEMDLPDCEFHLTGYQKSVGRVVTFHGRPLTIEKTDSDVLRKLDIVILCTPTEVSRELVRHLIGGPVVIDTSSAFRMEEKVPLVVPEVNGASLWDHEGLIAGPNCSTIQLVMSLCPIEREFGLFRVHVSTYQSVSGAGYKAMQELRQTSLNKLVSDDVEFSRDSSEFPHPIAFNLIPQIDSFVDNGYSKEEMKMVNETRKILGIPDLSMSCTCVRVPVFIGHSEACLVETKSEPNVERVREVLTAFPGVTVLDDPANQVYPMPLDCEDTDDVYVGRIRRDLSSKNGILYWLVADNLRRGAATNACNIAKMLIEDSKLR
ncbi:MAG: aspartate-semialdehyde dehydrogenase [Firmicutes bacterium]|nr:aspartate-semialdehyde dehydrogenase [Candidatus Fermentithermobacillaceae bacterium]